MQEEFLGILEDYLGVSHMKISLAEKWAKTGPLENRETPLKDYMRRVCERAKSTVSSTLADPKASLAIGQITTMAIMSTTNSLPGINRSLERRSTLALS